jgi:hypothetical protein
MMQSAMRFLVQIPSHKAVAIDCIVGTNHDCIGVDVESLQGDALFIVCGFF